jgi:CDGSH-type Zn-finger protein
MTEPVVAANQPAKVALEKGRKYFFCACGKSNNQPFCDSSHRGSEFTPLAFECSESKDYYLCQCKRSNNKPYCDGSHKAVTDDQVGKSTS